MKIKGTLLAFLKLNLNPGTKIEYDQRTNRIIASTMYHPGLIGISVKGLSIRSVAALMNRIEDTINKETYYQIF